MKTSRVENLNAVLSESVHSEDVIPVVASEPVVTVFDDVELAFFGAASPVRFPSLRAFDLDGCSVLVSGIGIL